jgi:hypothetical protein
VREVARRLRSLAARFDAIRWPAPARTVWSLADRVAFFSLMCEVERADVRSPVDGACFASGRALDGTPIRLLVERCTDGISRVTLEQTPGGHDFDRRGLFEPDAPVSPAQADRIWGRLSERYAEQAAGEVTAWVYKPWDDSTWKTRELPALRRNPRVTAIRVIDLAP